MFHKMPDPGLPAILGPFHKLSQMFEKLSEWFVRSQTYLRREYVLGSKRMDLIGDLQTLTLKHYQRLGPDAMKEFTDLASKMLDTERQANELHSDHADSAAELNKEFAEIMGASE